MHNQKGFTLIELIITLAVISLISAIIYPNFMKIQEKAKINALKANLHTIEVAIEGYFMDQGIYPNSNNSGITGLSAILIENGELNKIPTNPFTGKTYTDSDPSGKIVYSSNDDNSTYSLIAYGKGNKEIAISLGD